ncbi:hypothetical protein ACQ4M3_39140 [Leptolyngbya sp. AN03gr2]|uniref:hypothetical protein n=1 Tax=Leptolyngbya sp. AN03gr2 TaxID=3423364 RepID=UPI00269CB952
MKYRELSEAEEVFREEALKKIAAMIEAHGLSLAEVSSLYRCPKVQLKVGNETVRAKSFDPFFDAW